MTGEPEFPDSLTFPEFIDNRNGNTLAKALDALFALPEAPDGETTRPQDEKTDGTTDGPPATARIATAYFNPGGFAQLAGRLAALPEVRLLLGADPLEDSETGVQRTLGETPDRARSRRVRAGLHRLDTRLRRARNELPFSKAGAATRKTLLAALGGGGSLEVRRYEQAFLHAKAYLLTGSEGSGLGKAGLIAGSANFTAAGLTTNLELALGRCDAPLVERARNWFDELWEEAEPYDLAALFEELDPPRTPWEVFLRVLFQLYGDEVEEDARADNLPLTTFQKHGAARALRLIDEVGGAIVADEVGLGKTFIAGEILERYRERRQRALLVCPASLRDSTWMSFLTKYQMYVECVSFEQLAADRQLCDARSRPNARGANLQRPLDEYQLVVVDEAHNYRNPQAPYRAGALRKLLFGKRRDLLLLTATPVNNSLWDLYHLIRFFLRQDSRLASRGIRSLRDRFRLAMRDPSNLHPDVLYPVIDATTVKRTRQFVKKHYGGDTIAGPDGAPRPIVFPRPQALSVRYRLDDALPGSFDRVEAALDPESDGGIRFARYRPEAYLAAAPEAGEHAAAAGLLRSALLKRFESSAFAFQETTKRMVEGHDRFLKALEKGRVLTTKLLNDLGDDEAALEDLLEDPDQGEDASRYDAAALRAAVRRDREILVGLTEEAARIQPEGDPKLRALADALERIVREAQDEGVNRKDERQKAKVIVFSSFGDTVSWVRRFLDREVQTNPRLAGYRNRIASVRGSAATDDDEAGEMDRWETAHGFAPVSMEAGPEPDRDRYDLLVSTDVLAEGVNLQQCRNIINYDLPWNPMRLVQRHGRIDRIGSPHREVFLRTIFPADRLDDLLKLEGRILRKLAMAAASVGVAPPIEGSAQGSQVFTETREEIERLLLQDAAIYERGGTAAAAQTGEEYRQTLRKALEADRERIVGLPRPIGSGMAAGGRRGMFFCAVVGRGEKALERTYLRFVPADASWRIAPNAPMETETAACLRLIECEEQTPAWFPDSLPAPPTESPPESLEDRAHGFWEHARRNIRESWMRETDPANLQPAVRRLNRQAADFIRAHPPRELDQQRVERALDILETPWPRREEVLLRQQFGSDEDRGPGLARELVEWILGTGLEPEDPPVPLPPIDLEDIELLCWMGIEPASCPPSR